MTNWNKLEVERIEHRDPDAVIYRLSGVLTSSHECYEFLEDVQNSVRHAKKNVILVLKDVERITSAGVGILAACFTSTSNAEGKLVLADIPKPVELVLNVVRLLTVVEHHATEEEALSRL